MMIGAMEKIVEKASEPLIFSTLSFEKPVKACCRRVEIFLSLNFFIMWKQESKSLSGMPLGVSAMMVPITVVGTSVRNYRARLSVFEGDVTLPFSYSAQGRIPIHREG